MTTPPEHAALLAAGYTVTQHTPHRIDYERGTVLLVWFAGQAPGQWSARADGDRMMWQTRAHTATAAEALAGIRRRIAADARDLLALAASATLDPLP